VEKSQVYTILTKLIIYREKREEKRFIGVQVGNEVFGKKSEYPLIVDVPRDLCAIRSFLTGPKGEFLHTLEFDGNFFGTTGHNPAPIFK
jgi:hypothetical protein